MPLRILCVGAHPDDVEIGMGGTVASLVQKGHELLLLDLTNGEPTPFGSPEIRAMEAQKSAAVLGARRKTLHMPNRYLEDSIENRKAIAEEIRAFRPDYVFAPYFDDAHPDHIAASALVDAARFYAKLTKSDIPGEPFFPKRVIYYYPVHLRLRIQPSFLNDISATISTKAEAIRCYHSQFAAAGKAHLIDCFLNENRYWGFQAGCEAAEPFFQKEIPVISWPEGYI
jgi:bacillithiol biosynthesis deacetylase BshB1